MLFNMEEKTFNMFVYGSLRDSSIFKSVCGLSFGMNPALKHDKLLNAELALLAGYRKVSPDNVYYYAVKKDGAKLEGIIIYDVPAEAFAEIDRYEGKLYERETVTVATSDGDADAEAYLVSHRSMRRRFGDRATVDHGGLLCCFL